MWYSHPRFIPRVSRLHRAHAEACFTTSSLVPLGKTASLKVVQARIHDLSSFILHAKLGQVRSRTTGEPVVERGSELALVYVLE